MLGTIEKNGDLPLDQDLSMVSWSIIDANAASSHQPLLKLQAVGVASRTAKVSMLESANLNHLKGSCLEMCSKDIFNSYLPRNLNSIKCHKV